MNKIKKSFNISLAFNIITAALGFAVVCFAIIVSNSDAKLGLLAVGIAIITLAFANISDLSGSKDLKEIKEILKDIQPKINQLAIGTDEKKEEKKQPDDRPTPSLDICLEEARRNVDFQMNQIDGLDSKSGIFLGIAGVIFTLLITSLIQTNSSQTILPHSIFIKIALIPILLSIIAAFIALLLHNYSRPPKLEELWNRYLHSESERTKKDVATKIVAAVKENDNAINQKALWIKTSYFALGVGILALVLWVILFIFIK